MTLVKSDIPELLTAGLQNRLFRDLRPDPRAVGQDRHDDPLREATRSSTPGSAHCRGCASSATSGSRAIPKPYAYAIQNKTWESTLSVDRAALEDDQYGQIALRIRQMALVAKTHLDSIVFGLLGTGFTANGYDGVPFFGSHANGQGAAQSNKGTDALSAASLQAAITAMMRFTDDQGRPMGTQAEPAGGPAGTLLGGDDAADFDLVPGPAITASQDLAANPLRGMVTLLATPYLTSPTNWFLLDTTRVLRALVLQMRKEFEFGSLESASENGFLRDQFLYGVRARYNAGFGDWRASLREAQVVNPSFGLKLVRKP